MQQVTDDVAEQIEGPGRAGSAPTVAANSPRRPLSASSYGHAANSAGANRDASNQSIGDPARAQRFSKRNAGMASSLAWGVSGFIVGAVFWHMIGFWAFVSDVVFSSHAPIEERFVDQAGANCVEIVLDRATGRVYTEACATEAPQLDERSLSVKSDFLGGGRGRLARPQRAVRVTSGAR